MVWFPLAAKRFGETSKFDTTMLLEKIHRNWRSIFVIFALGADTAAIFVSAIAAFNLRDLLPGTPTISLVTIFNFTTFFASIFIGMALILGVYRPAYHRQVSAQYFLAGKAYLYAILL